MINQSTKFLEELFYSDEKGSYEIDEQIVQQFISNPDFPWLISFPRTGSHWLRMLMELYFEKPSLVRAFYFKDATDFTCYHRHDQECNEKCKNVIYLYRHPIDTIYSQLNYYKEDMCDYERIEFWTTLYAKHLVKWIFNEKFTDKKTIIIYEGLKENLSAEFEKICKHLNVYFDARRLATIAKHVSKNKLKEKTTYDPQVVNVSSTYQENRSFFKNQSGQYVLSIMFNVDSRLKNLF